MRVAKISAIRIVECESREAGKVFKIKKRILSGVENLDNMGFIVGRFILFENLFKPRQLHLAVEICS